MKCYYNQSFSTRKNFYKSSQEYVLYIFNNCGYPSATMRAIKKDLTEAGVNHIISSTITKKSIKQLLTLSLNGIDDLCDVHKLPKGYQDMSMSELCEMLEANPTFLKRTIVSDGFDAFAGWSRNSKPLFMRRFSLL